MTLSLALQLIGIAASLAGILLIAHKHEGCWPVFIVSNLIFVAAFIVERLYALLALNLIYLAFNAWAWRKWAKGVKP